MKWLLPLIVTVAMSIVGVIGDSFINLAGEDPRKYIIWKWFWIGFIVYAMTAFGWFYVMKHARLGTIGAVYAVVTVLALTVVSIFFFKEQYTLVEGLGIALAIASLVLLARFV